MAGRLNVTPTISIGDEEIALAFVRATGPGGQNVNKVATAVQLRFDLFASPGLPEGLKRRAALLAGRRLTAEGVIVLVADRFRTQGQNREDAVARLLALLEAASHAPRRRIATRPTLASKTRRLESKSRRGAVKKLRGRGAADD